MQLLTRRDWLSHASSGAAGIALAWLLGQEARLLADGPTRRGPHFQPKAKRAIHIFSPGGASHIDLFDFKPELERLDGTALASKGKLDPFFGQPGNLMKSVYAFAQHGQSGAWVSALLPHLATCVDDLVFLHSMVCKSSSHTPACFQMNTGYTQNGFPSVGSWLSYGLGTENEELPTFVVLPDPRGLPNGGTNNWSQGFLPAEHQATAFKTDGGTPIDHLETPPGISPASRLASMELVARYNRRFAEDHPADNVLQARVAAYELAARMQSSIPSVVDFADETAETQQMYGLNNPVTAGFGRNCLLARRLIERGVRFVQLYNGGALGSPRINWDAHENVKENHDTQGVRLDQPCAALLKDLKRRGLLEDTLVFWSTEFGRTPFTQGLNAKGRDHHPLVFTGWLAGAGLKKGIKYGASDEVGYQVAENPVTIYDFHATILHLLGLDHTQLTYYHNGLNRRLTDVHGHVIDPILA